jgi:hypothetical protein
MSMNGYIRITRGLAGRIRSYVDRARGQAGGDAPPPPIVAPAPPPVSVTPPPVKPRAPKLDDPLADAPAIEPKDVKPVPEPKRAPPAKGAPADLLPPDIGAGIEDGNSL